MKKILFLVTVVFITLSGQTCSLFGQQPAGIFRSIDGGKSWQSINDLKIKGVRTDNPQANVFSLTVDPRNPDIIYTGTLNRGIYKSDNGGRTWKRMNNGISLTGRQPVFYDIVVDAENNNNVFCAGKTREYGKIYKSSNGGDEWREVFSESQNDQAVLTLAISISQPTIIVAGSQGGGVYASTDSGESWQHAGSFNDDVISVGISNSNSNILYAATRSKGVFRSENFGRTWTGITKKIGPDKDITSNYNGLSIGKMAIAPSDGNVIYLGTRAGIFRSQNGGHSWTLLSTLLPQDFAPLTSDIKVAFQNPNIIYFSVPNVVYKAENSGGKWVSAQLSVSAKVNKIAIDRKNPNIVYVGIGK